MKSDKPNNVTPLPTPQTIQVVAVPLEVFSDVLEILQELPFKTVGKTLNKLGQLAPQQAQLGPSPSE